VGAGRGAGGWPAGGWVFGGLNDYMG